MERLKQTHLLSMCMLIFIGLSILTLPSCSKKADGSDDEQRILFLKKYGAFVDRDRPSYSSQETVPIVFDAVWDIRDVFAKDLGSGSLSKLKGKQCGIFMYPLSKLPFEVKKDSSVETRAVVLTYKEKIVCSYIDFISETRGTPPVSLSGTAISDITGVKWTKWKAEIENDDNKKLAIWNYYVCLMDGRYDEAYSYIYDRANVKKDDFIKTAKSLTIPDIDFLNLTQSDKHSDSECSFTAEVKSPKVNKNKTYRMTFDLKKDPSSNDYGGWKIVSTSIK